ncbi:hypothetical protein JKP88DRAFT_289072 [Tribonema minus]|uniref:Uncharacterized protein n=1 Tax=Tribonema minus TaxID=303371 RepID=A0A836CGK0_9STRA|nr:hypothetical protein JKP88DRAFT_289072 [Tribonema minus]
MRLRSLARNTWPETCAGAARHGCPAALQYLQGERAPMDRLTPQAAAAARAANTGVLQRALGNSCEVDDAGHEGVARCGQVPALQRRSMDRLTPQAAAAARGCHTGILQRSMGAPSPWRYCSAAGWPWRAAAAHVSGHKSHAKLHRRVRSEMSPCTAAESAVQASTGQPWARGQSTTAGCPFRTQA